MRNGPASCGGRSDGCSRRKAAAEERLLDERKRNGAKRLSKIPPQPLKKKRVWAADVGAAARVAKMCKSRYFEVLLRYE